MDKLEKVKEKLDSEEVVAHVEAQDINPTKRLGYNDHGLKHIDIVRERASELLDLLSGNIEFGVNDHPHGFGEEEAHVVAQIAATLHDVGHMVHRHRHVYYSVHIADRLTDKILKDIYPTRERVALKGDILHAVLCHHVEISPLTAEAGIVRIADALDMEQGRSRLPYDKGERSINTVSSQAVTSVTVKEGSENGYPVMVEIELNNSAGVYQIDNLLKSKLKGSGLESKVKIVAINKGEDELVGRIEL